MASMGAAPQLSSQKFVKGHLTRSGRRETPAFFAETQSWLYAFLPYWRRRSAHPASAARTGSP